MPTYVVGDVQGCFEPLQRLLAAIAFEPARDRIWLVGDLVNRGPHNLEVLRWARDLGDRLVAVLGNHDLHLLAAAEGLRAPKKRDTLQDVLGAPDRASLLGWLRGRPLVHREGAWLLVHAGLLPAWSAEDAERLSRSLAARLQAHDPTVYDDPDLGALTRVRLLDARGRPAMRFKGPPEDAPASQTPWYAPSARWRDDDVTVLFGHWAAQGYRRGDGWISLDTGCVWGERLSALRLEDGRVFSVPAKPDGPAAC